MPSRSPYAGARYGSPEVGASASSTAGETGGAWCTWEARSVRSRPAATGSGSRSHRLPEVRRDGHLPRDDERAQPGKLVAETHWHPRAEPAESDPAVAHVEHDVPPRPQLPLAERACEAVDRDVEVLDHAREHERPEERL